MAFNWVRIDNQRQVNEFLSDIDQWHNALMQLQAAYRSARGLAAGAPELVEETLAVRLQQLAKKVDADENDWRFGKACDEARLAAADIEDGVKLNLRAAAARYPGIFTRAGLDVKKGATKAVAASMKKSPIRLVYLAALDDWGKVTSAKRTPRFLSRLFAIANEVDTDPWRKALRNLEVWKDRKKLNELAKTVRIDKQSPHFLVALAYQMSSFQKEGERDHIALLRRALADHPRDFWMSFHLGTWVKDAQEQESCFRTALAIRPLSAVTHRQLGGAFYGQKRYEEAVAACTRAIALAPNYAAAYNMRGMAWVFNKKAGKTLADSRALADFNKAIDLDGDGAAYYNNRGVVWRRKKQYDKAIADFNRAIDRNPEYALAYSNRAHTWHLLEEYDKAIDDATEAIDLDPNSATAYYNCGNIWRYMEVHEMAIQDYTEALRLNPRHDQAYYNRGRAFHDLKNYNKAIADYTATIRLKPTAAAHLYRGFAWQNKRKYDNAMADYDIAIRLRPSYAAAYNDRGNVWLEKKEYDKAIAEYDTAIVHNSKYALPYYNRGRAWTELKEYDRAIADYKVAIDLGKKDAAVYNQRGRAWLGMKEYDNAIADYDKARRLDPKSAFTYLVYRGNVRFAQQQYDKAILHYNEAIRLKPNSAWAFSMRGKAQFFSRRYDDALASWREALKISPNYAWVMMRQAHFLATCPEGQYRDAQKALELARKALALRKDSDPQYQEMLAAVFADAGNFAEAIQWQERAVQALSLQEGEQARARLHLFRKQLPYRQP
jgi:tetratricopeptide (TPR) repeat protein